MVDPNGGEVYIGLKYTPSPWWDWSAFGALLTGNTRQYPIDIIQPGSGAEAAAAQIHGQSDDVPLAAMERAAIADALAQFRRSSESELVGGAGASGCGCT
ncbi:MAG TPA: hypothetical protein VNZ57_11160 [Longimicrobiales bacterium]|nr:hypothetical protein [Longimicrobiales bacterium]